MVNPILVPAVATDDQPGPSVFSAVTKKFDIATQTLCEPPAKQKTPVNSNQGNNTTENFLEASLRLSTHCKYNNYIKQWTSYSKIIGHIEGSHVLDLLSGMFDKGHAYSTINSAKCAIATIVHIPPYNSLNKHTLINKYTTGVFNLRPPKPKLSFVWDVDILFRYFEQQDDNNSLSDKPLTQKLLILLYCLVLIELVLSNYLVCLTNMVLNDLSVTFILTEVLKHSRKGKTLDKYEYRSYTDKKLCIISCLREYLTRRDKHVEHGPAHYHN